MAKDNTILYVGLAAAAAYYIYKKNGNTEVSETATNFLTAPGFNVPGSVPDITLDANNPEELPQQVTRAKQILSAGDNVKVAIRTAQGVLHILKGNKRKTSTNTETVTADTDDNGVADILDAVNQGVRNPAKAGALIKKAANKHAKKVKVPKKVKAKRVAVKKKAVKKKAVRKPIKKRRKL